MTTIQNRHPLRVSPRFPRLILTRQTEQLPDGYNEHSNAGLEPSDATTALTTSRTINADQLTRYRSGTDAFLDWLYRTSSDRFFKRSSMGMLDVTTNSMAPDVRPGDTVCTVALRPDQYAHVQGRIVGIVRPAQVEEILLARLVGVTATHLHLSFDNSERPMLTVDRSEISSLCWIKSLASRDVD